MEFFGESGLGLPGTDKVKQRNIRRQASDLNVNFTDNCCFAPSRVQCSGAKQAVLGA